APNPSGPSLRGNPSNLRLPVLRVKSGRCDPRRDPHPEDPSTLVSPGNSVRHGGRSSFPFCRGTRKNITHPAAPRQARTTLSEVSSTTPLESGPELAPGARLAPRGLSPGSLLWRGELLGRRLGLELIGHGEQEGGGRAAGGGGHRAGGLEHAGVHAAEPFAHLRMGVVRGDHDPGAPVAGGGHPFEVPRGGESGQQLGGGGAGDREGRGGAGRGGRGGG